MKQTKEQLLAENAKLTSKLEAWEANDRKLRDDFADLLDQYEWIKEYYSYDKKKVLTNLSWHKIAFLVGELKADANYSILLEEHRRGEKQNMELMEEIHRLKNPNQECDGPTRPCR